jgi:hypothetical protein
MPVSEEVVSAPPRGLWAADDRVLVPRISCYFFGFWPLKFRFDIEDRVRGEVRLIAILNKILESSRGESRSRPGVRLPSRALQLCTPVQSRGPGGWPQYCAR